MLTVGSTGEEFLKGAMRQQLVENFPAPGETTDEMEKAEEVAKVLAMFEEQDLRTRCFPNLEKAQAFKRELRSGDYEQALTINLEDYRLPKVSVMWVVRKDEKVAVYFQDGTARPLDVLRRRGQGGEAIPSS